MNPSLVLDEHRTARAEALARAGADQQACETAVQREAELAALIDAAENRAQAERLAAEQAQARAANEAQVRRLAIEKARAEQAAEAALKAAQERIRSEQAAETLALAKLAAEQETARVLAERLAAEREAAAAATSRRQVEAELEAARRERAEAEAALAGLAASPAPERTASPPPEARPPAPGKKAAPWRSILWAAFCLAAGIAIGFRLSPPPTPTKAANPPSLQLDYRLSPGK